MSLAVTPLQNATLNADSYLLEVADVCKSFPGVAALQEVSLRVKRGSVHALVGENGAGKSTLMKIIAGMETPDSGELRFKGERVQFQSPREALQSGIAMIHQELNLMGSMSVAENIWIGREPCNALGLISHRALHRRTRELLDRLRIDIEPRAEIRTLSVAGRQLVEIAKALSFDSDLLIMDEPTSALTDHDAEHLFTIIRELKRQGKGILYITHRMEELFEIADEVSVFRDGRHITTDLVGKLTPAQLIRLMVGRELSRIFPRAAARPGDVVLSARKLTLEGHFHEVSFDLRAGEIVGVAGLIGSGRTRLAECLFGLVQADSGQIFVAGTELRFHSPGMAMAHGMAFVTEDRQETGCFLRLSVLENLQISALSREFVTAGFVRSRTLTDACEAMSRSLRVRTPGLHAPIANLSGGNQQKVLLGRWLLTGPKILILDEPTRGVDVGAKSEIHELISSLVSQGTAVLMISSELPEILGMSHRILIMHEGRITGTLEADQADQVKIMELASQ